MNKKLVSIYVILFALLMGCSEKEDFSEFDKFNGNLILTSTSEDNLLLLEETLNFSVADEDGLDYTAEAEIYVDNSKIDATNFTFTQEGPHEVYATLDGVKSNTLDFEVVDGSSRILQVSRDKALRNQEVVFELVDADGNNYSNSSTFYINDSAISGNTFSTNTVNDYSVYAEYEVAGEVLTTDAKSFVIFVPIQKIMIEDYTGTWCGYCPAVTAAVEEIQAQTDQISIVAVHNNDEMALAIEEDLRDEFEVYGFPSARINRTVQWGNATNFPPEQILNLIGAETETSISIDSQIDGSTLNVEVGLLSETEIQNKKLVVYITEDGILSDQTNYYNTDDTSPYFGMGNPIPDFEHNHVLRASLTDIFGDSVPATSALTDYTRNFSYTIPSGFNNEELHIVVMLVDQDNTAVNTQNVKVGEYAAYE